MTIQEYLDENLPFYHITPTKNLESILSTGLEWRNSFGICVTRSIHPLITEFIVEQMLLGEGDVEFSIIEIIPNKHNIQRKEVMNDRVIEVTNPLHNYIRRNRLIINSTDVIDTYTADPLGSDVITAKEQMQELGLIVPLSI